MADTTHVTIQAATVVTENLDESQIAAVLWVFLDECGPFEGSAHEVGEAAMLWFREQLATAGEKAMVRAMAEEIERVVQRLAEREVRGDAPRVR